MAPLSGTSLSSPTMDSTPATGAYQNIKKSYAAFIGLAAIALTASVATIIAFCRLQYAKRRLANNRRRKRRRGGRFEMADEPDPRARGLGGKLS